MARKGREARFSRFKIEQAETVRLRGGACVVSPYPIRWAAA